MDNKKKQNAEKTILDSLFTKAKSFSGLLSTTDNEINTTLERFGEIRNKIKTAKTDSKEKK